mgnify:FL=1
MNALEYFANYINTSSRIIELLAQLPESLDLSMVVRAWEKGGLLAPAWKDGTLDRAWINVVAHQAATAVLAYKLCRLIERELASEGTAIEDVIIAALIHDAPKRLELEMHKVKKTAGQNGFDNVNRDTERFSSAFFAELGFSELVVSIAVTTGNVGLDRIIAGKASLGQKLVFYADCCVSGDRIVGYEKRFDDVRKHFEPRGQYLWELELFLRKYGVTKWDTCDGVVLPLQEKLARLIGFQGNPNDLHTHLVPIASLM